MAIDEHYVRNLPDNVDPKRFVDFDLYNPVSEGLDLHRSWKALQDSSPFSVMWTPHNGGHWIATRGRVIEEVYTDPEHFSSFTVLVPKETVGAAYRFFPLSLDPPRHRPFRNLLNHGLLPKAVRPMEDKIRRLTIELIEGFRPKGRCNFSLEFAENLPLPVFMDLVDLPMSDLPKLKHLADQFTRPDGSLEPAEVNRRFHEYIAPVIAARRGKDGADMLSRFVNGEVFGRPVTDEEAANLAIQVLVGGLDTVVNFMGFAMLFLAENPDFRHALAADPELIPDAIMELLRRFGLASSAREVKEDIVFEGATLRQGDMIYCPTWLHGLDDSENDEPLKVELHRHAPRHSAFGKGDHTCPGQHLARTELRILFEEWLARIPDFSVEPGTQISFTGGIVCAVNPYNLVWDVD